MTDMQKDSSQDHDWSKSGTVSNTELCDMYAMAVIGNVKSKTTSVIKREVNRMCKKTSDQGQEEPSKIQLSLLYNKRKRESA